MVSDVIPEGQIQNYFPPFPKQQPQPQPSDHHTLLVLGVMLIILGLVIMLTKGRGPKRNPSRLEF